MPLYAAYKVNGYTEEQLLRATALSYLVCMYIKEYSGRLSAFCGCAIAAGSGTVSYTHLHAVIDGTKIIHSKPDPEVFQKTLEALHLSAGECIVVEDALSGVEAGHGAGMRVACVGQAARENRGDYNLEKLSDILKIVI